MAKMKDLPEKEIKILYEELKNKYSEYRKQNLRLDMSRGKPSPEQLDLSSDMLKTIHSKEDAFTENNTDTRNYGGLDGIPEAKKLFADMLEVESDEIIVGSNSSLNMMYNVISLAMAFGEFNSDMPWKDYEKISFLCPCPGYDRHFSICEHFNINMINVDMTPEGPDIKKITELASEDKTIKGIWCVPKYSNPDGITYSDEIVEKLAGMDTAAPDFRIYWDNAYAHHHINEDEDKLKNIFTACKSAGNQERVYLFGSTSKITYAGSGVAMMASGENNRKNYLKHMAIQTIGPDKVNQLRHVRFLKNMDNLKNHMKKHAEILKPKFDIVLNILEKELQAEEIAWWTKPNGGYFISLNTMDNCAGRVVKMAAEAGVTLTGVGATFPYGKDPRDRNIRLAPSFPSLDDLEKAIEIVALCVKIVTIEENYLA